MNRMKKKLFALFVIAALFSVQRSSFVMGETKSNTGVIPKEEITIENIVRLNDTYDILEKEGSIKINRIILSQWKTNGVEMWEPSIEYKIDFVQTQNGIETKWDSINHYDDNSSRRRFEAIQFNFEGDPERYSFDQIISADGEISYRFDSQRPLIRKYKTKEKYLKTIENDISVLSLTSLIDSAVKYKEKSHVEENDSNYILFIDYTDKAFEFNGKSQKCHMAITVDKNNGRILHIIETQDETKAGTSILTKKQVEYIIEYGTLEHIELSEEDLILFKESNYQ